MLLFDQNISFRLVKKLGTTFPGSKHISDLGLIDSTDSQIWEYARKHNFCIVSFDTDFIDLSVIKGHPPKVILIRTGNTSTDKIVEILLKFNTQISDFLRDDSLSFLEIQ